MADQEQVVYEAPRKKEGEVLRAALSTFKGKEMVSVRVWYTDEGGTLRPSKNGLNVPAAEFPEFERCITEIRKALTAQSAPAAAPAA